jgi:hypothetical protein
MKKLLTATLLIPLLITLAAYASDLPPCPEDQTQTYHNCFDTITFANGNKYVGEFKDGKENGQGTHTFPSGDKYVGEYKDDKKHGKGTMTSGSKYVGELKNGDMHGQGTMTWVSGAKYVGEFKDDKRHGNGTMTSASGAKYVGEFKDDKRHGKGTVTYADGTVKLGIWADDEYFYDLAEHRRKEENNARTECAKEAGKANTEYAAKQIKKTCLAEKQLEPESKSWYEW